MYMRKTIIINFRPCNSLRVPIPDTERGLHDRYADMLPVTPCIVDPVNPANNVYLSGVGPDPYE